MMPRLVQVLLLSLLMAGAAQGQDSSTIEPFTSVEGDIPPGASQDWTFSAVAGELISLEAEPLGELDPVLTLLSETGAVLLSNDDYDYPNTRTALLQAVTIPFTGTYTVRVGGFDGTVGRYTLTMLRGFASGFNLSGMAGANWTPSNAMLQVSPGNQTLTLSIAEADQNGFVVDEGAERLTNYYAQVTVNVEEARPGWVVHMTARHQNRNQYYVFSINHQGLYRFTRQAGTDEIVLRDWVPHPAIVPGTAAFEMGVLANGAGFDLFYNGNLLGKVVDDTLDGGVIGLGIGTLSALESSTTVRFSDLRVTVPRLTADNTDVPVEQLILASPTNMAQALERRRVIPPGGELILNVPESTAQSAQPGVTRLQLGRGSTFTNFVLATEVSIQANEPTPAACGLYLRSPDDERYVLAFLDQLGGYGLSERQGGGFAPGIYGEDPTLGQSEHQLLLVANEGVLRYYIDGRSVGTLPAEAVEGGIGNAVVNFQPNTTICQFENTWLWGWS